MSKVNRPSLEAESINKDLHAQSDLELARKVARLHKELKIKHNIDCYQDEIEGDVYGEYEKLISQHTDLKPGGFNLYPGPEKTSCCSVAYFLVLKYGRHYRCAERDMTFKEALDKIVKHMQGECVGITKKAILITSDWDLNEAQEWLPNMQQIRKDNELGIYLTHDEDAIKLEY